MSGWRPLSWDGYIPCGRCGVASGRPCINLVNPEQLNQRPHPDRYRVGPDRRGRRVDPDVTADRLTLWKRLAPQGVSVASIAHQLGMKRSALDQFIVRARRNGHPDAVYHLFGPPRTGPMRRRRRPASQR